MWTSLGTHKAAIEDSLICNRAILNPHIMSAIKFQDERPIPCLKDNKPWKTSKTYTVKDPHDPKTTLHQVSCVNEKEAIEAVEAAHIAFKCESHPSSLKLC